MTKRRPRKKKAPRRLTPQRERFALEYVVDLNGTQAAIRAGYAKRGASRQASALLKDPLVVAKVTELAKLQAAKLELDADTVLQGLLAIATLDLGELFDENHGLRDLHALPETLRRSLAAVEIERHTIPSKGKEPEVYFTHKIKTPDRLRAYELLGKHLKLFVDVQEVRGNVNLIERIYRARRQVRRQADDEATT